MGREVKRVAPSFDWYEKTIKPTSRGNMHAETWKGYILEVRIPCFLCGETGLNLKGKDCQLCWGDKTVTPRIEPPYGDGWQMWEDTSEGSPISPVFNTKRELAKWLAETGASAMGSFGASEEEWFAMIGKGSAPTGVITNGVMMNGVEAVSKLK